MSEPIYGTAINCMDGRVHLPLLDWMKATYGVDYVDLITEPGPDKLLSSGSPEALASVRDKAQFLITVRGSKILVVAGHHDCKGNPVSREYHKEQIRKGVAVVRSWGLPATIVGVWINQDWQVEVVDKGEA